MGVLEEEGRVHVVEAGIRFKPEIGHAVIVASLGAGIHVTHATGVGPAGTLTKEAEVKVLEVPRVCGVGIRVEWDRVWAVLVLLV